MVSNKLEYDSNIGGHVATPDYIHTYHYAAERVAEVRQLINAIQNPSTTKLAFQTLPKHMLRRAMSHHPKRLPRRYRNIHESQMTKSGSPQTNKRPSRKYRRKPSNLLKEYIRRQQKHVWLETHIWYAKRFHMVPRWGYKLPLASCAKTFRASYRASASHCLLQDVSFLGCLSLRGPLVELQTGFDRLTSRRCGLGIAARAFIDGKREGSIHLFRADRYPKGAIGTVCFIWKPDAAPAEGSLRELWMFVHPSIYQEVTAELISVFKVKSDQMHIMEEGVAEEMRTVTRTAAYTRCPSYTNSENNVCVTELKDTMNRFRLTGPLSQSVLASALKCKEMRSAEPDNWFKAYLSNEISAKAHLLQSKFWSSCEGITSPAMLTSNMVLGLNVEDPRLNRPAKRTKALPSLNIVDQSQLVNLPIELSRSSIWDKDVRAAVTQSMVSTHELSTRRNRDAIVPGERCKFEDDLQPVPLLLIQRPGSQRNSYKRLGYGCGWDVIATSGYGMNLWLCLIMQGARPGGLREMISISRESGTEDPPDTLHARRQFAEKSRKLKEKYFRLPPNKRVNYRKLGIASPFACPFLKLINDWAPSMASAHEDFHVIRDKQQLQEISDALRHKGKFPCLPDDCLLPIYLKIKGRGNPGDFSLICLPKSRDLKIALKQQKYCDKQPVFVEPLHEDRNENQRKKLRKEHKILLKRLRSRRVREKRKKQETSEKRIRIRPPGTSSLVAEQLKKMSELWLPDVAGSIRYQCSREVFGYVTQSCFSFTEAAVMAIGYVTISGLKQLLAVCKGHGERLMLIRGTKTRNYRFASFKINCSV